MKESGTVYFFTGLAGAGKSTIGGLFYEELKVRSPDAVLLDGDKNRSVSGDHDYSTEARRRGGLSQMRRCKEIAEDGRDVVICMIAMYREVRAWAREHIENYCEIYIKASMETLVKRDQKGLYTKVRKDVVGLDLPWEEPETPDAVVQNDGAQTPEEIVAGLERRFWGEGL